MSQKKKKREPSPLDREERQHARTNSTRRRRCRTAGRPLTTPRPPPVLLRGLLSLGRPSSPAAPVNTRSTGRSRSAAGGRREGGDGDGETLTTMAQVLKLEDPFLGRRLHWPSERNSYHCTNRGNSQVVQPKFGIVCTHPMFRPESGKS